MKTPPRRIKNTHKKIRILSVVILVLIAVDLSWYGIVKHKHDVAVNEERTQFSQAEKQLDALSAKITAKFGEPEQNIKTKNCGYTSNPNEFEKGDLYCYVDYVLVYPTGSFDNATGMMTKIENLSPGIDEYTANNDDSLSRSVPPIDLGGDGFTLDGLDCTTGYKYFLAETNMQVLGYPHINRLTGGQALLTEIQCSARPAKTQYFPLVD